MNSVSFLYNEFITKETLLVELKEFSLHKTGVPFDIHQAELYCYSNRFAFSDLVFQTIPKYMDYIPKYACAFLNAKIPLGTIYIGIDDDGFVKGIPIEKGQLLDKQWISSLIQDQINQFVKTDDGQACFAPFNVEVIPVQVEQQTGLHPEFSSYLEKRQKFDASRDAFVDSYKKWSETFELVTMKLVDIVNHTKNRVKLIEYMEQASDRNEVALQTIRDPLYQLPSLAGEGLVRELKLNPESVFHWVTRFKDELNIMYKKEKPVFHSHFKQKNVPFTLLIGMSEMIPYWADQIDVFVIKIEFSLPKEPDCNYLYQYWNGTDWIQCQRIISYDQPVCMPS